MSSEAEDTGLFGQTAREADLPKGVVKVEPLTDEERIAARLGADLVEQAKKVQMAINHLEPDGTCEPAKGTR